MRFVGHGHGAIRATHDKTLEISRDPDITARATCVIAVDAGPRGVDPGSALAAVAGRVRVTISAGGESFELTARANSSWDPAGPAVIRRSPLRLPGTFATHADAAATDLPRALVAALQDPDVTVEVGVAAIPATAPTVVLFAADPLRPDDPRLRAELEAADTVIAQDPGARRLATPRDDGAGRTLVIATAALPRHPGPPDADLETVGLAPDLAAAAASPGTGPVLLAPDGADLRELLLRTTAAHRLTVTCPADRLGELLASAREVAGRQGATVVAPFAPPVRVSTASPPAWPGRDPLAVCLDAVAEDRALDPTVHAAVDGLLAAGVPTRAAADALATLAGWPRRRAYDEVLSRQQLR